MPLSKHTRRGVVRKHIKRPERNASNRHAQHSIVKILKP